MPYGTIPSSESCESHYNEDAADVAVSQEEAAAWKPAFVEGLTVFCTVVPGFQVDHSVKKADVLWF